MGGEDNILSTNLGTVWRLLRPSCCPHPQANLDEELTERVRLSPRKDEDLGNLNVTHKLILSHREESKEKASKSSESSKILDPGTSLDRAARGGEHSCDEPSCVSIQSFLTEDLATWI